MINHIGEKWQQIAAVIEDPMKRRLSEEMFYSGATSVIAILAERLGDPTLLVPEEMAIKFARIFVELHRETSDHLRASQARNNFERGRSRTTH